MRQLSLVDLMPCRPKPAASLGVAPEDCATQLALFADNAELMRDLDLAIDRGDLMGALSARQQIVRTYGGPPALVELDVLARVTAAGAGPGLLAAWLADPARPSLRPALARRLERAVTRAALATNDAATLVARVPKALPLLANTLAPGDARDRRTARCLVRDALAAGHALEPRAFDDPDVADVLAEDRAPLWQACLGALRGLWPPAVPTADQMRAFDDEEGDDEGFFFWVCLGVATWLDGDETRVHAARRWMKALDPELHAIVMSRVRLPR